MDIEIGTLLLFLIASFAEVNIKIFKILYSPKFKEAEIFVYQSSPLIMIIDSKNKAFYRHCYVNFDFN